MEGWLSFETKGHFKEAFELLEKGIDSKEMCLKWLVFLITPLDVLGMWFDECPRKKHHKVTCFEEIGLHLQIFITKLHSSVNTIGEGLCIQLRNQQTCTSDNHD